MAAPLRYNFIFSNQARYRISRHLVFWSLCVVFFTLIYGARPSGDITPVGYYHYTQSFKISFLEAVAYLPGHILLSYIILYWLIPRYLFKERYLAFLVLLVATIFLEAIVSNIITNLVIVPLRQYLGLPIPVSSFYFGIMAGLRGGLSVAGFAGIIKLGKYCYWKNQQAQDLEQEKLKAELQLLKAQVHPHFLFNTLNNLYSLTLTQSGQAPEVVLKLAGLLRYMLYECNVPLVPLEKEIKLIQDYIELEKLRYGDRLDLAINITGDPHGKSIAPLLLLPFLENSFKHGASEHLDQAWISLDLIIRENKLKFKLINALPTEPLLLSQPHLVAQGIGLENVKKRLALIYPQRHKFKTIQESETFMVILTLNLDTVELPIPSVASELNTVSVPNAAATLTA
jgi:sensor histidine kinase YesM